MPKLFFSFFSITGLFEEKLIQTNGQ